MYEAERERRSAWCCSRVRAASAHRSTHHAKECAPWRRTIQSRFAPTGTCGRMRSSADRARRRHTPRFLPSQRCAASSFVSACVLAWVVTSAGCEHGTHGGGHQHNTAGHCSPSLVPECVRDIGCVICACVFDLAQPDAASTKKSGQFAANLPRRQRYGRRPT